MKNKVLVIAAHPDDEVLGIGGTVLRHARSGDDVYCLIAAEGVTSRLAKGKKTDADVKRLRKESLNAADILGFKEVFFLDFPDNAMDSVPLLDVVKGFEKVMDRLKPDIIYTHHENDLNVDHRICFQAAMTAARPIGKDCVKKIYAFETLSSTEWQSKGEGVFRPNVYYDISGVMDDKLKAMKAYRSELRKYPHPRSLEGIRILAQFRGLESGLELAEALCLVREIG